MQYSRLFRIASTRPGSGPCFRRHTEPARAQDRTVRPGRPDRRRWDQPRVPHHVETPAHRRGETAAFDQMWNRLNMPAGR